MKTIHDPNYAEVIARLKAARKACGLSQEAVANKLGWHRSMLSNIENRERRADILEMHDLCRVYGLRLSDLEPLLEREGGSHGA